MQGLESPPNTTQCDTIFHECKTRTVAMRAVCSPGHARLFSMKKCMQGRSFTRTISLFTEFKPSRMTTLQNFWNLREFYERGRTVIGDDNKNCTATMTAEEGIVGIGTGSLIGQLDGGLRASLKNSDVVLYV